MASSRNIRASAVAGLFYPAAEHALAETVDRLLGGLPSPRTPSPPRVVVAPHAGYVYSGRTAARGFKAFAGSDIETLIIVGPSHVESFDFTSVFDGDAYETPLGRVAVNQDLADAIATVPSVRRAHNGHRRSSPRGEHAIEVELPFLQRVLNDFDIVPIIMGDQSWESCAALGGAIRGAVAGRDSVAVVASSDLSHFYTYERAVVLDSEFCRLLEMQDPRALHDAVREGRCEACGAGPVVASMLAADTGHCEVLERINSGDVTGDHASVVGYAAAVMSSAGDGA